MQNDFLMCKEFSSEQDPHLLRLYWPWIDAEVEGGVLSCVVFNHTGQPSYLDFLHVVLSAEATS